MANTLNSARQARQRALKILSETERYVIGVNEDGKKFLYHDIESKKEKFVEINRAIGEIDNILSQLGDTFAKNEMLKLRSMLEEREHILCSMLDRR